MLKLEIPRTVESIFLIGSYSPEKTFEKLEEVVISKEIDELGEYAFANCTRLTNITIPDRVTYIGGMVFKECTSLTKIKIMSTSLESVDSNAFYDLPSNAKIYVLNEEIKNKVEASCNGITVEVVTEEEMKNI